MSDPREPYVSGLIQPLNLAATPVVPGVDEPTSPGGKAAISEAITDMQVRARRGYYLGAFTVVAAGGLAWYSFCSLKEMAEKFVPKTPPVPVPSLQVFYVSAGGHIVITVALVWFIYQLLRAAERMVLPRHLSTDADLARTLLGISSPHREATRLVQQLISTVLKAKGVGGEE